VASPPEKKSVDGVFARMLHVDDASLSTRHQEAIERQDRAKENLKNAAASTGKFIGGMLSAGDRKKAHLLHQDLIKITDDIDIALATNKKDEA